MLSKTRKSNVHILLASDRGPLRIGDPQLTEVIQTTMDRLERDDCRVLSIMLEEDAEGCCVLNVRTQELDSTVGTSSAPRRAA